MTIALLNDLSRDEARTWLNGLYEHSPWVAEAVLDRRPFLGPAQLRQALIAVVRDAPRESQLALLQAHPELAGRLAEQGALTAESASEQARAGLKACSPEELMRLRELNDAYQQRFGWPFIVAVRGPRGTGLSRGEIIATFERRLQSLPDAEFAECLRQVHRIAELRLNDKLGIEPVLGQQVWDCAELLAQHTDPGFEALGQLTCTYLTPAHIACQVQLQRWMTDCGFDDVSVDAVGNVVGIYHGTDRDTPRLLTGSHYDTVRNAGKYDGRLGIFVPMVAVRELHQQGRRLPFGIEVVGFAEEEGQRFKATFLGSSALTGQFDAGWLLQRDAGGIAMHEAMASAGLDPAGIDAVRRDPSKYLGFVEVHIEQGPVLNELDLPLGVVTSINGSVRYVGEVTGVASHAGTTPMDRRRDAATAVAELALYVELRAATQPGVVGTVGMLVVPDGSINVVPGRCVFSLDLRAPSDESRDALEVDVLAALLRITERRGLRHNVEQTMRAAAAPSAPDWELRWESAVTATGVPVFRLPSGAGHDAMKLHEVMPQAMLFVRGSNGGISHNPLESVTADDAQLAVEAFSNLVRQLADAMPTP